MSTSKCSGCVLHTICLARSVTNVWDNLMVCPICKRMYMIGEPDDSDDRVGRSVEHYADGVACAGGWYRYLETEATKPGCKLERQSNAINTRRLVAWVDSLTKWPFSKTIHMQQSGQIDEFPLGAAACYVCRDAICDRVTYDTSQSPNEAMALCTVAVAVEAAKKIHIWREFSADFGRPEKVREGEEGEEVRDGSGMLQGVLTTHALPK